MSVRHHLNRIFRKPAFFSRATHGNVATIFALALIPIIAGAGVGFDYARAMIVRERLAEALDAAGLAVGSAPGLSLPDKTTLATKYFYANYTADKSFGIPAAPTVTIDATSATLSSTVAMPTTLMNVVGITTMNVGHSSKVVWGQTKLWVSLVLDNTGSMSQGDSGGTKIAALKSATKDLLGMLQNAASNPGDVKVSLIPFSKDVNTGTGNVSATWLDWTDWQAPPPGSTPSSSIGPGSTCPYGTRSRPDQSPYGYRCASTPTNGSSLTDTIPSSGTYKGYICPGPDDGTYNSGREGHYYNGCYTSVGTKAPYAHLWVSNAHSTWAGCIEDRSQDYDVQNTTPTGTASDFSPENADSCPPGVMMGLTYDWDSLNSEVDSMQPQGSTNQAIGLAWGWQSQTSGNPMNAGALPKDTQQILIILSDGLNTQNRWSGDGSDQDSAADDRMNKVCANAKAAGMTIYAVFVDIGGTQGNSTVLQNCATDTSHYFDLTSTSDIETAFDTIGMQITQLRVAL
jgi:Flp pilus assembly protein TadG